MLPKALKVFLACAFGAGIGSLIALEISAMFCWVGFITGGLTGYLSYEWKKILSAIPTAYQKATSFKIPKYSWKTFGSSLLLPIAIVPWILLLASLLSLLNEKANEIEYYIYISGVFFIVFFAFPFFSTMGMILAEKSEEKKFKQCEETLDCGSTIFFMFFMPIVLFWHLPHGIFFCVKNTPRFTKWFISGCILVAKEWGTFWAKFLWNLFLLIHSEIRVLCGIDALIGSMIGFFTGSTLIGALAGGLCGVVNYIVITELCLKPLGYIPIKSN